MHGYHFKKRTIRIPRDHRNSVEEISQTRSPFESATFLPPAQHKQTVPAARTVAGAVQLITLASEVNHLDRTTKSASSSSRINNL